MKVVIDIPDNEIPKKQDIINIPLNFCGGEVCQAGGYGFMVLPKGHGDLIDREVAKEEMREAMCGTGYQHIPLSVLNSEFLTPAVIEADKDNDNDL